MENLGILQQSAPTAPKPTDGSAPVQDKYQTQMSSILQNASSGIDILDFMKQITRGGFDAPLNIKLAIARNYYTTQQAFSMFFLGIILGSGIMTILFLTMGGYFEFYDFMDFRALGMFLFSFFVSMLVGRAQNMGIKTCDPKQQLSIEAGKTSGYDQCIDDSNCTIQATVPQSAQGKLCTYQRLKATRKLVYNVLMFGSLILGVFIIYSTQSATPAKNKKIVKQTPTFSYAISTILGLFSGEIISYLLYQLGS